MAETRADAASILKDSEKDKLFEIQTGIIERVQSKTISERIKAKNYSGDATAGSVTFNRLVNSQLKARGTARTAGKGDALNNKGKVAVLINDRLEIVEEVANDDVERTPIPQLVQNRQKDHEKTIAVGLERKFFEVAEAEGSEVVVTSATTLQDKIEMLIQSITGTKNDYVDGVEREDVVVILNEKNFGLMRTYLDKIIGADNKEIYRWHGVQIESNFRQTKDAIAMRVESIAQPYVIKPYNASRIPLSDDTAIEMYLTRGTKAITPDLIKWATL